MPYVPEPLSSHGMEVAVIGDPGKKRMGFRVPNGGKGVEQREVTFSMVSME